MTDRDRLIELVDKAKEEYANDITDHTETDYIVETLLNEGLIVPPCKLGQRLYDIGEYVLGVVAPDIYELRADEMTLEKGIDGALNFVYDGMYINNEDIGETVFRTKEEAEEKLRELNNNA